MRRAEQYDVDKQIIWFLNLRVQFVWQFRRFFLIMWILNANILNVMIPTVLLRNKLWRFWNFGKTKRIEREKWMMTMMMNHIYFQFLMFHCSTAQSVLVAWVYKSKGAKWLSILTCHGCIHDQKRECSRLRREHCTPLSLTPAKSPSGTFSSG